MEENNNNNNNNNQTQEKTTNFKSNTDKNAEAFKAILEEFPNVKEKIDYEIKH